ncbi:hypothetical protein QAD02_017968 [Eretmocerus hayati]|uniref:Uncharacterized protein n=1 Tax=Eretmocerus hayati TaxID=131215 RepID=A0ACC2PFC3_9HYME|nr:hypothetical protein QAD02_017968 [Eretmocerus hayati]
MLKRSVNGERARLASPALDAMFEFSSEITVSIDTDEDGFSSRKCRIHEEWVILMFNWKGGPSRLLKGTQDGRFVNGGGKNCIKGCYNGAFLQLQKLKPAKQQIETMSLFLVQEPEFGVNLMDDKKWEELMSLLHAEERQPKFKRCEWERFWIQEVQEMLKRLDSCGKGLLDYYTFLAYQAHTACKDYAKNKMGCGTGRKSERCEDESDSELDQSESNGLDIEWCSEEDDDESGEESKFGEDEELKKLEKRRSAIHEQRMHPFARNPKLQKLSTLEPSVEKKVNVTPGQQLLITLRSQLSTAGEKIRKEAQEKMDTCKGELEVLIENEVRCQIKEELDEMSAVLRKEYKCAVFGLIKARMSDERGGSASEKEYLHEKGVIFQIAEKTAEKALRMLEKDDCDYS